MAFGRHVRNGQLTSAPSARSFGASVGRSKSSFVSCAVWAIVLMLAAVAAGDNELDGAAVHQDSAGRVVPCVDASAAPVGMMHRCLRCSTIWCKNDGDRYMRG